MPDHRHILTSVMLKYLVSSVLGYIKGKSAIHVARHFLKRGRNYGEQNLWTRGYFVDSTGCNEEVIRRYIRSQEQEGTRQDELKFGLNEGENVGLSTVREIQQIRFERFIQSSLWFYRRYLTLQEASMRILPGVHFVEDWNSWYLEKYLRRFRRSQVWMHQCLTV